MIKAFFLRIVSKSQCNRIHKNRRSKTKRKEVSGPFRLLQIGQRTPFKFWPRWLSSCWTIIVSWLICRMSITCTFIAVVYVDDFLKEKEIGVFCVIRCEKSLDSQPWIFKGLSKHHPRRELVTCHQVLRYFQITNTYSDLKTWVRHLSWFSYLSGHN